MTHASIPLSALARFPRLFVTWAALTGVITRPVQTGRHRADVDEPVEMIVLPLDAIPAAAATDPVWPTKDEDAEPGWPDTDPDACHTVADHIRYGHLDRDTRTALAAVVEAYVTSGSTLMPAELLAALENVVHETVLANPVDPADGAGLEHYVRRAPLAQDLRFGFGALFDVYLNLGDTRCLGATGLVVALEQAHQLLVIATTAAPIAERSEFA
jgi:hypothetical protein